MFQIVGISFGGAAQNLGGEIAVAEILFVLLVVAYGEEFIGVVENFLPYGCQLLLVGHEDAAAQAAIAVQTVVFHPDLEVVASFAGALDAVAAQKEGYVRFVRPFVGCEAQVTVYAVEAFLGIRVTYGGVDGAQFVDDIGGEVDEFLTDSIVAAFVGHEPFAVVIGSQFFKESDCIRRHNIE